MNTSLPKILIADDDKDMLKALSMRLWDLGYETISATDSNQVITLVREAHPDVIVLDVNMPAGDGFSVHEKLKQIEEFANQPVIYLTGDKSSRLDSLAQGIGAVTLFHKPFQIKDLVAVIDQVLKKQAA